MVNLNLKIESGDKSKFTLLTTKPEKFVYK